MPMSVTKTQGSFPDDGSDLRRREGPSAQSTPVLHGEPEPTVSEAAEGRPDALTGLPDVLAAAGRAAGRVIEAIAGVPPAPLPTSAPSAGDQAAGDRPLTTGVIFVHGIGSQKQGETLLQWSAPLIEVLTAWRRRVVNRPGMIRDPVEAARIDFADDRPTIDIVLPEIEVEGRTFKEARWILTESWWAAKVAPPGLSTMTGWLGPQGGAGQIADAVLGNRTADRRLLKLLATGAVVPFVSVLAGVILSLYVLFRAIFSIIPIPTIRDAAVLRSFDEFLTGWFGDVRILLYDPAQSANIRSGLAGAIRKLREVDHVDRVVVVAHSGGAMVSYLTLTDPVYADLEVDKLITFGEGWNLATTLTPADHGMSDRLRLDITKRRHPMLWRDYWASHDPAPAGDLNLEEISDGAANPERVRSRMVWNRRSLLGDHGSYFDNDEEFTLSVLREIEAATGWGETPAGGRPPSRFYPTPPPNEDATDPPVDPRERRHRERVAILALWRHLAIGVPIAVITAILASPTRLSKLGEMAIQPLTAIPVVNDIGTPVIRFLDSLEAPKIATFFTTDLVATLGLATLQAIVVMSVLQLLVAPVTAFEAWDRGHWKRWLFLVIEAGLGAVLIVASVHLLFRAPEHDSLLGSRGAWVQGVVLTLATLAFAVVGSLIAKAWPASTRGFSVIATTAFAAAMAASVFVIFDRPGLETGELGYVVIWALFIVLYKVGVNRWSQWDRIERQRAYYASANATVRRRSVWLSMLGFPLAGLGLAGWLLGWAAEIGPLPFVGTVPIYWALLVAGGAFVLAAIAVGSIDWRDEENPINSPGAVELARGRV